MCCGIFGLWKGEHANSIQKALRSDWEFSWGLSFCKATVQFIIHSMGINTSKQQVRYLYLKEGRLENISLQYAVSLCTEVELNNQTELDT